MKDAKQYLFRPGYASNGFRQTFTDGIREEAKR